MMLLSNILIHFMMDFLLAFKIRAIFRVWMQWVWQCTFIRQLFYLTTQSAMYCRVVRGKQFYQTIWTSSSLITKHCSTVKYEQFVYRASYFIFMYLFIYLLCYTGLLVANLAKDSSRCKLVLQVVPKDIFVVHGNNRCECPSITMYTCEQIMWGGC